VFQNYALFPHMTVGENVAFPLSVRRMRRAEIAERVRRALEMVRLEAFAARRPAQLSGGQQQRIALARALVFEPSLVLMDEPLGALDKKLREQMQIEIKRIHRSVGTTVIYVTHDQTEALTMSDLVVVMHQARVAQAGTPRTLYEMPANLFVADFLGDSNLLPAKVVGAAGEELTVAIASGETIRAARGVFAVAPGDRVVVLIRPEDMSVDAGAPAGEHPDALAGTIRDISYHGDTFKLDVAAGGDVLKVKVARAQGIAMQPGERVMLRWKPAAARILPAADHIAPHGADR
jgi:putative spermidine/putrescine transport system ATP-binding protein